MAIPLIIFFATFVQGASGFGLALVAMPLLVGLIGVQTAAPLVSLVGIVAGLSMVLRYRATFNWRAVIRLSAASLTAIPLGIYALGRIDAVIVTTILGIVIIGYALYALLGLRLPQLERQTWAYGFGFISGLLGGAYNTSGPPVIIYGSCRRWPPSEFKSNLQGFFLLNTVMVLFIHALNGNFTPLVWRSFGVGLPAILLGLWAGVSLDGRIAPQTFRRVVLVLLLFLGGRLLI